MSTHIRASTPVPERPLTQLGPGRHRLPRPHPDDCVHLPIPRVSPRTRYRWKIRNTTIAGTALMNEPAISIPVLMACLFISAVPAIVVYLIFQRYLVRGLTLGMGK